MKNIHNTLHTYRYHAGFILVALFLLFFFGWEYSDSDATSRTILYDPIEDLFTIDGNAQVEGVLGGLSPLKLSDDIEFVGTSSTNILYRMFVQGMGEQGSKLLQVGNGAFEDTLVIETAQASNANFMHLTFFDEDRGRPSLTLNTGTPERATVIENSLMVGIGSTTLDADYTKCVTHGALFIDCDTALTGGDLLVADDVEILGNLYVHGTVNDISAKIEMTADQAIGNNSNTKISWDTEVYDTDGMVDLGTSDTRITIKTAGKYMCTGQGGWDNNSDGVRVLRVMHNNSNAGVTQTMAENNSQNQVHYVGEAAVDDYFEFQVKQNGTGGDLDFTSSLAYFECRKVN